MSEALRHPLLARCGVPHGFGTRTSPPPTGLVSARQVHGTRVARVDFPDAVVGEADALLCTAAGVAVGVRTADCVPVLLSSATGELVAAVHAGWRGLAAGVVAAGLDAFRAAGGDPEQAVAVIGPSVGGCCYEVDGPVLGALRARFEAELDREAVATRPGHARIDLGRLVRSDLARGLPDSAIGRIEACTQCDARRFHSYRRDGANSGRLVHWIATRGG
jgi:YfiH family protein